MKKVDQDNFKITGLKWLITLFKSLSLQYTFYILIFLEQYSKRNLELYNLKYGSSTRISFRYIILICLLLEEIMSNKSSRNKSRFEKILNDKIY